MVNMHVDCCLDGGAQKSISWFCRIYAIDMIPSTSPQSLVLQNLGNVVLLSFDDCSVNQYAVYVAFKFN